MLCFQENKIAGLAAMGGFWVDLGACVFAQSGYI